MMYAKLLKRKILEVGEFFRLYPTTVQQAEQHVNSLVTPVTVRVDFVLWDEDPVLDLWSDRALLLCIDDYNNYKGLKSEKELRREYVQWHMFAFNNVPEKYRSLVSPKDNGTISVSDRNAITSMMSPIELLLYTKSCYDSAYNAIPPDVPHREEPIVVYLFDAAETTFSKRVSTVSEALEVVHKITTTPNIAGLSRAGFNHFKI